MAMLWLAVACSSPPAGQSTDDTTVLPKDTIGPQLDGQDSSDATDEPDVPQQQPCETEGGWGCPCKDNTDCADVAYCIDSELGKVCTKACSTSCPKDWKCVQASGRDLSYVCVPMFTNLCKPCNSHQDCAQPGGQAGENLCLPRDDGQGFIDGAFCGTACSSDGQCKSGFSCKEVTVKDRPEPVMQCVPDSGECTCAVNWTATQASTECSKTNDIGTCKSTRTCTADGLTLCGAQPASAEVCGDKEDNDCDGETDEADAVDCIVYYPDQDADGVGQSVGACLCNNPGLGFSIVGGDCNDLVSAIKPGVDEICNEIDDNCNGDTDEAGAKGCDIYYKDKDGDKFGDPDDSACLCKSKKTSEWIGVAGDCDDTTNKVKPGVSEMCNTVGVDDNCNGKTDEEGSVGCKLAYLDQDNDKYGPASSGKCLCALNKIYTTDQPGDCDDGNDKVFPTAIEACNGLDDDCSGLTDEPGAEKSCPPMAQGSAACVGGKCSPVCFKGWFHLDDNPADCECQADNSYGLKGDACPNAIDLGQMGDGSATVFRSGNLMPGEDGDWYHVLATDSPDDGGACDQFDVRAWLSNNPGNQFAIDMYKGGCAGASQLCSAETEVQWTTSYWGPPTGLDAKVNTPILGDVTKSPDPQMAGECKCAKGPAGTGLPGMNICSDNSADFYFRVYRKPGLAVTCEAYILAVINAPAAK